MKPDDLKAKAQVVALLVEGVGVNEAANQVGIYRQRIWDWRKNDLEFQRMLEDARLTLKEELVDDSVAHAVARLRSLSPRAVDVIETKLKGDDLKAAVELLKRIQEFNPKQRIEFEGTLEARLAAIGDSPSD